MEGLRSMKRFYDPTTNKRISKKKAVELAESAGEMVVKEKMTVTEARKKGFYIPPNIESVILTSMTKKGKREYRAY